VCTASAAGLVADDGLAHHVAAKQGLIGFMKTAAVELDDSGFAATRSAPEWSSRQCSIGGDSYDMLAGSRAR